MEAKIKRIIGRTIAIALLTVVFFIAISFALSGMAAYKQNTWARDYGQIIIPRETVFPGVKTQSIVEIGGDFVIGAHYPQTGQWDIDFEIATIITQKVKEFKDALALRDNQSFCEYHLDYEIISLNKDIIAIVFEENTHNLDNGRQKRAFSLSYDLLGGMPLGLDWFFVENSQYNSALPQQSKEKLMALDDFLEHNSQVEFLYNPEDTPDEFFTFGFSPQGLYLYFDASQIKTEANSIWEVLIPYGELFPLCRINEEGNFYQPPVQVRKTEIDPLKPMVALTFDDGPTFTITPRLLDALRERDVLATFFVLGSLAKRYPDIITKMDVLGHEIGSHGYDHLKAFTTLSKKGLEEQLDYTKDAVLAAIGKEPTLVRPPYGSVDKKSAALIDKPIIMWNIDSRDWKSRDPQKIKEELAKAKDGDIILMHDLYESSLEGAILGIEALKEKGIQFVTVSELLEYKGIEVLDGKIYYYGK